MLIKSKDSVLVVIETDDIPDEEEEAEIVEKVKAQADEQNDEVAEEPAPAEEETKEAA